MDIGLKPLAALALALVISMVVWLVYQEGVQAGRQQVKTEWQADQIDQARARSEAMLKARQREQDLQTTIDQLRGEYGDRIKTIASERDALVRELRRRPEARASAGGVLKAADAGAGCTGEGLARPDAEFLVGFASDAARLDAALSQCRSAYEAARQAGSDPGQQRD